MTTDSADYCILRQSHTSKLEVDMGSVLESEFGQK